VLVLGGEGHQNLDQASDQVERPALCRVIPPREEGCGCQKLGPQVPSFRSTEGGMQWRQKYKIPDHRLNLVFGHYGVRPRLCIPSGSPFESLTSRVVSSPRGGSPRHGRAREWPGPTCLQPRALPVLCRWRPPRGP
jgi:hypothetical protein